MIAKRVKIIVTTGANRSVPFLFLIASVALWLFMPVSLSFAQDISISADSMEQKGDVQILRGSVRIERDDISIKAESAKYEEASGDSYAEGNVHYEDSDITIRASKAHLNLRDNTGMLYDGEVFIKHGGYRILGKEIQKTGKNRYILKNASATTCDGVSPAWCFTSRNTDVLVGERLKAKHATFRVKGMPLFYTPYLWVPIITERRTGFLTPTLGYQSATGLFYRQPFFWAISENRDATLFLDVFSQGSFGQGVEYRYNTDISNARDSAGN
jgi:LPS-assembly protein